MGFCSLFHFDPYNVPHMSTHSILWDLSHIVIESNSMDQCSISDFLGSIKDHLKESQRIWMETGSRTAPTPGTSAKIAFEGVPKDYLDSIEGLHENIWGGSSCVYV